jgi:hypothetical protein
MTHREKVDFLINDARRINLSPWTVAPPLVRLMWTLGIEIPPPLFLSFFTIAFWAGSLFGVGWGGIMWLIQWREQNAPIWLVIAASGIAGISFGVIMAYYMKRKARQLGLPDWKEYPNQQQMA